MKKNFIKLGMISPAWLFILLAGCNGGAITAIQLPSNVTPDTISFSPATLQLNNPLSNTPTASQQLTLTMSAVNSLGQALLPSANNPIHIELYGAPNGVISPTTILAESATVTFSYSGKSFPNNITINAWINDSTNHGAAIGVTQALMQNTPPTCSYGPKNYQVPLVGTLPNSLQIMAAVGYAESTAPANLKSYTLDTGSLGVIVPINELVTNRNVIGPGAPGFKYYDSSGNTYSGNYYLASVSIKLKDGAIVQTQPILVLGINKAYCTGPASASCYSNPPAPDLHYMGVGFNRNGSTAGDLFNSPTANAFLHLTNLQNGSNITPGYYLTPSVESTTGAGLVLGVSDPTGYTMINLTANPAVPGDFNPQPGCFSFPNAATPNKFCGTALLDIGIAEMFIDLPQNQRPAGTYNNNNNLVPLGVKMAVEMGSDTPLAMAYSYTVESPPAEGSAAPTYVEWINSATTNSQTFVNTGRRPLYNYNYLYNGQCGQVGFQHLE